MKDTKMKYRFHTRYDEDITRADGGWFVVKESTDLEEFEEGDKWAFNEILTKGHEFIANGYFKWDIVHD